MSLMHLSPEAVRVRRLARAHAAGELSTTDYRRARRQAIDRLSGRDVDGCAAGDDTETRQFGEASGAQVAVLNRAVSDNSASAWLKWLLALGVVAAVTLVAAAAEIPPVAERDPNPSTSPRYQIEAVTLSGVDRLPQLSAVDVQAFVEDALAQALAEQVPGREGFTTSELAEVGRYLSSLGVHERGAELDAEEADELVALIADQKRRRGLSLSRLEGLAGDLQTWLRASGLPLASAFVPSQRVVDGTVTLSVLPGRLAEVDVAGPPAAQRVVERLFSDQIGGVVTDDVGNRLLQLADLAGLTVQGAFEAGDDVGDTRLRVAVLEDAPWQGQVVLDNFGDDRFGDHRLGVSGRWLSPTGVGDRLDGHLLHAFSPTNAWSAGVGYQRPFGRLDDLLSASVSFADAQADGLPGSLQGDVLKLRVGLSRSLVRSRQQTRSLAASLHRHELSLTGRPDQSVSLATLDAVSDQVFDKARVSLETAAQLGLGRVGSALPGQDSTIWFARADAFAWTPLLLADQPFKLSAEAVVLLADTQLPETLRLTVGGADAVRGFDFSIPAVDRGLTLSGALHREIGVGELRLFADAAYGDRLGAVDDGFTFATSVGLGWRVALGRALDADLTVSAPLTSKQTGGLSNDGLRLYWRLRYQP